MRKPSGEPGVITVFLCIVLTAVIAITGVLIDGARLRVAEAQLRRSTQLALDSVMASYSRSLREDYGLFALSPGVDENAVFTEYFKANLTPNAQKQQTTVEQLIGLFGDAYGLGEGVVSYGDPLRIKTNVNVAKLIGDVDLPDGVKQSLNFDTCGAAGVLPLTDPAVMYNQVVEFGKYRVPVNMIQGGFAEDLQGFIGESDMLEKDMAATQSLLDAGRAMQDVFDQEKTVKERIQAVRDAQAGYNEAVSEWNELIGGGKTVEMTLHADVELYGYDLAALNEFRRMAPVRPDQMFAPMTWASAGQALDVPAYTVAGYKDWKQQKIAGGVAEHNEAIWDTYNDIVNEGPTNEDYHESWVEGMDALFAYIQDVVVPANNRQAQALSGDIYSRYPADIRDLTAGIAYMVNGRVEAFEAAIAQAKSAQAELTLRIRAARDDLDRRDKSGDFADCSIEVAQDWTGRPEQDGLPAKDGDYRKYTALLDDASDNAIAAADQLDDAAGKCKKPDAGAASSAYENSWRSGSAFDPVPHALSTVDEGEIEDFPLSYQTGEDAEQNANKLADEVKQIAKDKKPPVDDEADKKRFRTDAMPSEYAADLSDIKNDAQDAGARIDKLKKDRAKDVEGDMGGVSGPIGELLEPLQSGVGNVLGSVYVSDYMLSMFGNAAPQQQDQKYEQGKPYQRVTSLRGAIVPTKLGEQPQDADGEAMDARVGFFYNAEVEYMLYGKAVEKSNVSSAKLPLTAICMGFNVLQVRNNDEIKLAVEAASDALMAFTGVPSVVFRIGFYLILAGVETGFDMYYLMRGYKLPILSRDGKQLLMFNDVNDIMSRGKNLISYEFYLRLQLIVKLWGDGSRAELMRRMANLMQLNIRYRAEQGVGDRYVHDKGFAIDEAHTSVVGMGAGGMPYWFMNAPMMGESRQRLGLRVLRPAVAVESY